MQRLIQKRFQRRFNLICDESETTCCLARPEDLLELALVLRSDPDMEVDQLLDIVCEDVGAFRLTYVFQSSRFRSMLKIQIDVSDKTHIPSLAIAFQSADWLEREVFDLFGVYFDGHPGLKRLLLYPEFAGHPLRKNYPADKVQPLVPIYV